MKSRFGGVLLLLVLLSPAQPAFAAEPAPSAAEPPVPTESVASLSVSTQLGVSNLLHVDEEIQYDFADTALHPVVRSIPVEYNDDQGNKFKLEFKLVEAKAGFDVLNLKPAFNNGAAHLTLPAPKGHSKETYRLKYSLAPVALRGYTEDVLTINVTGTGWKVPIIHTAFDFKAVGLQVDAMSCSTLAEGTSTGKCSIASDSNSANVTSTTIDPIESLIFSASFPKHQFQRYLQVHAAPLDWVGFAGGIAFLIVLVVVLPIILALRTRRRRAKKSQSSYSKKPPDQ